MDQPTPARPHSGKQPPTPESLNVTTAFEESDIEKILTSESLGSGSAPGAKETPAPAVPPTKLDPAAEGKGVVPPAEAKEKTVTLGDFCLLKKLGNGGMGAVYKARQISLDRDVALKVLFKHLAEKPAFVQRFHREARLQAKLDHPNIVRGYWVGEERGLHLFAMEFVDAGSIQSWLKKKGKFSVGDALHIILACSYALQHAHEQNMIHRDIKPDNLLLSKKGIVKVADLGLAKALSDDLSLTQTGIGAGTPHYMAPEQARSAKYVDGRSDIYALGTMLYVFLSGQMPYKGETTLELIQAKEQGKHLPVRRLNPEVPEKLDLIIDKMMANKPEHRYQTCEELIKDLESLGRASPSLSFMPMTASGQFSRPALLTHPKTEPVAGVSDPGHRVPADTPPAAPAKPGAGDWWYVSYETEEGEHVTRKLTTEQVSALIKTPGFDLKAQASHHPKSGFRAIATYREFEVSLRGRLAKAKADRKAARFKGLMKEIEEEDLRLRRRRWLRVLMGRASSGLGFILFMLVLAGIGYLIYLVGPAAAEWLARKLGLGAD